MDLEIIWSAFAEKQLDKIFNYYKENAGEELARKLIRGIISEPNKLRQSPFLAKLKNFCNTEKFPIDICSSKTTKSFILLIKKSR